MSARAILALDIDGTITDENHLIPHPVKIYLKSLVQKNFVLFLITGRSYSFAKLALDQLNFPYYLALQHGADILQMPDKSSLFRSYLDRSVVKDLESIYEDESEDFILYSGIDQGDFCYYRPAHFSSSMLDYLETLKRLSTDPWKAVTSYSSIEQDSFPLIKCFGGKNAMQNLEGKVKKSGLVSSIIKDPISGYLYLLMITGQGASKGQALKRLKTHLNLDLPVIAAGDDTNDISMLKSANVKIVMNTAPHSMHPLADILAPPSTECGIIPALEQAIRKWKI